MAMISYEVNFDGLVGPTHNYSGLAYGNLASMASGHTPSNPRAAALQGLEKMKFLADLGIKQGVLPPHERPHLPTIRKLGFTGPDRDLPNRFYRQIPDLFPRLCSSSFMWAANIATISPSIDCEDQHVHITPANLTSNFHRAIEAENTANILKKIFPDPIYFVHHDPLPDGEYFRDEGSANHTRLCRSFVESGVHLFVFGDSSMGDTPFIPTRFPARQTKEASEAVARQHEIYDDRLLFWQQNPTAVDAGVFHNDVISVGNQNFLLYHEKAFLRSFDIIEQIEEKVKKQCDMDMIFAEVSEKQVPLEVAVSTYLFNSQIVTLRDESMAIIAPIECQRNGQVNEFLEKLSQDPDTPIRDVHYIDLGQSMRNGGGPACLRMRTVLNQNEFNAVLPSVILNDKLFIRLADWITKHYREKMTMDDLRDPDLVEETQTTLDELTKILDLGSIYSFQR